MGFCLPLVGPAMLSRRKPGWRESAASLGLFLVGRLVAYLLFGLAFGALGGVISRVWLVKARLLPALYLLLGLMMIVYGIVQSFPHVGFCRFLDARAQSRWYLLVLGFLAGINLCPPFLLAVTAALDAGGALPGMFFFFIFFLATSIYMLPLLFAGVVARFGAVRFAARVVSVLAGGWFIYLAARTLLG
jgi:sulfite exporter TauE/SafE